MRPTAHSPTGGFYRPRNPRASPLYQCVARHHDELATAGLIARRVETEVLERFLDCGDLHQGFARIYCDQCGHDYLLAYSCNTRYFCPSCHHNFAGSEIGRTQCARRVRARDGAHQKRTLAYGEWIEEQILAPVPHRQYVFALLKLVRPYFRYHRPCLGALCRLVAEILRSGFSVHNQVCVSAGDAKGRRRLARYMIRNPFALAKMTYDPKTTMVIYRSQMHATLKRNYQLMPALKWLRLLLNHVPDKYEHLVRYYGYYSNRSRGLRRLAEAQGEDHSQVIDDDLPPDRRCKASWARLIQKVVAPGHPWPPRHWHIPVRHMKSIRSNVRTVARPCASSR